MKKLSLYALAGSVALLLIGAASLDTSFFRNINVNGNAAVSGTVFANNGLWSNSVTLAGNTITNWPSFTNDNWYPIGGADSGLPGVGYLNAVVATNGVSVVGTNAGSLLLGDTNAVPKYGTIQAPQNYTTNWVMRLPAGFTNGFFHSRVTGTTSQVDFLDFAPGTNTVFTTNASSVISINSTGGGGSGTGFPLFADANGGGFSITNLGTVILGTTNVADALAVVSLSDAGKFSKSGDSAAFAFFTNYVDRAIRTLTSGTNTLDLSLEGEQYLTITNNTTVTLANAPSGSKNRKTFLNVIGNGTNTITFAGVTVNWLTDKHNPPPASWIKYRFEWTGSEVQGAVEAPLLGSELPIAAGTNVVLTTNATGSMVINSTGSGGAGATMVGSVSNNVASSGLLAVDATKTNGIAATLSHMTNALGLTGSTTTFLRSDGTQAVPGNSATTTTQTNFVLNTLYTNGTQTIQVRAIAALTGATVSGTASLDLMADQAGGSTFTLLGRSEMTTTISLALNVTNGVTGFLVPSATYYWTNSSSGSGNSSLIVAGTGQIMTVSSGTNGATGPAGAGGTGYTIAFGTSTGLSPADNQTYYVGPDLGRAAETSFTNKCVTITKAGTIKAFYLKALVGTTAGTSELTTNYVSLNGTTKVGSATMVMNVGSAAAFDCHQEGLSQAVVVGDTVAIGEDTPGWSTNPTSVRYYGYIYIE